MLNLPFVESAGPGSGGGFTAGSVIFADSTGALGEDNANLFYDDSANRLGIGTTTPVSPLDVSGSISPAANESAAVVSFGGTIVEASSGTHARLVGLSVTAPTITAGAASVTNTATVYISGAPSASGATNYALWSAAGLVRFHSSTDSEYVQYTHAASAATAGSGVYGLGTFFTGTITGSPMEFRTNNTARYQISTLGNHTFSGSASTSGSPNFFAVTAPAHTTLTASTEAIDVYFDLGRTVQWNAGALTTQRAFVVNAPTLAFTGASTVTTTATFAVAAAPSAGTNATMTNVYAALVGGNASIGATQATTTYAAISVPSHTVTVTGTTQVTSACGFAAVNLQTVTVTDSSAVTVDTVATLYIAGAPTAGGSVTLTNSYALFVDAGNARFDGNIVGVNGGTLNNASAGYWTSNGGFLATGANGFRAVGAFDITGSASVFSLTGAGSSGQEVRLNSSGTNGIVTLYTANVQRVHLDATGLLTHSPGASTTGTPTLFQIQRAAHTGLTGEAKDFYIKSATATWTTTQATLRSVVIEAPTYAAASALNLGTTYTSTLHLDGTPIAGTNASFTGTVNTIRFGGDRTFASGANGQYFQLWAAAHTVTLTGTTTVGVTSFGQAYFDRVTVTDASAVTCSEVVNVLIEPPAAAGSVSMTGAYALQVNATNTSFATHAAGFQFASVRVKTMAITFGATTRITSTPGIAAVKVEALSVTQSGGAITIDSAASVYIAGPITAGSQVTITANYALWVASGIVRLDANLDHRGSQIGFFTTTLASKQTVTGSRGGNAALASLLTALATYGLITDSTTA